MKVLLSFFDYTGNWSKPYSEDISWKVQTFDIKHGQDILDFDPAEWYGRFIHDEPFAKYTLPKVGLLFAIPCTDYALSGAKWFKEKDLDGRTQESQKLVVKMKEVIDWFTKAGMLEFYAIENPMSRIHTLNPWMGKPIFKFNPCDFAGYDPIPKNSQYNKQTWLWGNFNIPNKKRLEPISQICPMHQKYGGKSERTKELRSITPLGFAYAFYTANKLD